MEILSVFFGLSPLVTHDEFILSYKPQQLLIPYFSEGEGKQIVCIHVFDNGEEDVMNAIFLTTSL